jgi:hypothetical protein
MTWRVLSADAQVLERLRGGSFKGVVHSVFARTVNIAPSGGDVGDLCPLVHRESDAGPGCMLAEVRDFSHLPLGQGDEARVEEGCLRIGQAGFSFREALPRQPEHLAYPVDTGRLRRNLRALDPARPPGRGRAAEETPFTREARRLLVGRARALEAALKSGREAEASRYVAGLLGLGPGLTPSGDDILLGLSATLALEGAPGARFHSFRGFVAEQACVATNLISAAGIREAVKGRTRTVIADFIRALLYGDPASAKSRLKQVLELGSSSGADMAHGIFLGMEVNLFLGGPGPAAIQSEL